MRYFVTGGAGFIGMHLVQKLLSEGGEVVVYDNLSMGTREHIAAFLENPRFTFIHDDLLNMPSLVQAMSGAEVVFHLAANSDIRAAAQDPAIELEQGTVATFNVLQAMKESSARSVVFTSSSVIYGDARGKELSEDFGPPVPISFYGSSKLAAEGLVCAFCHMLDMRGWIFRLANIVGKGLTHGVVFDFIRKLRENPDALEILGDGKQSKPYLHVKDCLEGMLCGLRNSNQRVNIFNLTSPDAINVEQIARIIVQEMGLKNVAFHYTGGEGGWKGDVPQVRMNADRLKRLGWRANLNSAQAVRTAVREVLSESGWPG